MPGFHVVQHDLNQANGVLSKPPEAVLAHGRPQQHVPACLYNGRPKALLDTDPAIQARRADRVGVGQRKALCVEMWEPPAGNSWRVPTYQVAS